MQPRASGGTVRRSCTRARARGPRLVRTVYFASVLLLGVTGVSSPSSSQAQEPVIVDLEGAIAAPLNAPQRDWYGVGGSLALGIQRPLSPWASLTARIRTLGLLDGDAPEKPGVRDPGAATLNTLSAGLVFRLPTGDVRRSTGLWVDAVGGGGFTGSNLRAAAEAGIGYGLLLKDSVSLSPFARYVQVFQPQGGLSGRDAVLGLVGVRLSLFDATPEPVETVLPDRDGDGVPDATDACIDDPEDHDDFDDEDGCPDVDNDQDSILDADDACPNMAEDFDGFKDEDGCPEEDNDHDGILDVDDLCPLEPETLNGVQDQDGCPDRGLIVMQDDRIVLEERVLFETDRARVHRRAGPVLNAIIHLWQQHPEWKKVRIEGHADVRGDPAFNQSLSERRAANVREALIKQGMDPSIIVAEGFGATRPRRRGTTDEDHQTNRRVEFVVIARGTSSEIDEAAGEPPPARKQEGAEGGGDAPQPEGATPEQDDAGATEPPEAAEPAPEQPAAAEGVAP